MSAAAAPVIEAMRQRASEIARAELDRTLKRIGADPELEAHLAAMADAVVSRLLQAPSARLRQASADRRRGERLVAAAVEMFGVAVARAPGRGERRRSSEAPGGRDHPPSLARAAQ